MGKEDIRTAEVWMHKDRRGVSPRARLMDSLIQALDIPVLGEGEPPHARPIHSVALALQVPTFALQGDLETPLQRKGIMLHQGWVRGTSGWEREAMAVGVDCSKMRALHEKITGTKDFMPAGYTPKGEPLVTKKQAARILNIGGDAVTRHTDQARQLSLDPGIKEDILLSLQSYADSAQPYSSVDPLFSRHAGLMWLRALRQCRGRLDGVLSALQASGFVFNTSGEVLTGIFPWKVISMAKIAGEHSVSATILKARARAVIQNYKKWFEAPVILEISSKRNKQPLFFVKSGIGEDVLQNLIYGEDPVAFSVDLGMEMPNLVDMLSEEEWGKLRSRLKQGIVAKLEGGQWVSLQDLAAGFGLNRNTFPTMFTNKIVPHYRECGWSTQEADGEEGYAVRKGGRNTWRVSPIGAVLVSEYLVEERWLAPGGAERLADFLTRTADGDMGSQTNLQKTCLDLYNWGEADGILILVRGKGDSGGRLWVLDGKALEDLIRGGRGDEIDVQDHRLRKRLEDDFRKELGLPEIVLTDLSDIRADDAVSRYLKEVGRIPLLTAKQELDLAKLIDQGRESVRVLSKGEYPPEDKLTLHKAVQYMKMAREYLAKANTRLVVSIAKKYVGRGMTFLDLIQEGNIGLMRAVEKFDHRRGYKFSTYATWWVRQAVTRSIADQGRTIRLPVHMYDQVGRLIHTSRQLVQERGREPYIDEIAERLDISTKEVEELVKTSQHPLALETPVGDEDDSFLGDFIEDTSFPDPQVMARQTALRDQFEEIFEDLPAREVRILQLRFGLVDGYSYTLEEVGKKFGVTRERIRQIEAQALGRLRHPSRSRKLRDFL